MNNKETGAIQEVVIALCRPGFESDAFDELTDRVKAEVKDIKTFENQGFLRASPVRRGKEAFTVSSVLLERKNSDINKPRLRENRLDQSLQIPTEGFIFVWDLLLGYSVTFPKETKDRVTPILDVLQKRKTFQSLACGHAALHQVEPQRFGTSVRICCPEAGPVPGLLKFTKQFEAVLSAALKKYESALLKIDEELVVFFESYESAVVAVRAKQISRKLSKRGRVFRDAAAPSRSGSKLSEAFRFFEIPVVAASSGVSSQEWAVDLGAAPGGWTKVLLENGYRVVAIDNGPLDASLKPYFASGKLVHLEKDAFHFAPEFPVSIVTCDVVDQPTKVADLMKKWCLKRYSNELVFNLKLPMKKRYQSLKNCLGDLSHALLAKGFDVSLDAHQLFHDRQEVTVKLSLDRTKEGL